MANKHYAVGNIPPQVTWTVVRGDTAAFRMLVTDDDKIPLFIPNWTLKADIKRNGQLITSITPAPADGDLDGEFTVSLLAEQSEILETGDIFDIQLTDATRVWTVAQGSMIVIEDVTD